MLLTTPWSDAMVFYRCRACGQELVSHTGTAVAAREGLCRACWATVSADRQKKPFGGEEISNDG